MKRTPTDPTKPIGDRNPPKETQFGQPGGNPIRSQSVAGKARQAKLGVQARAAEIIEMSNKDLITVSNSAFEPMIIVQFAAAILENDTKMIQWIYEQIFGKATQRVETLNLDPPKPLEDLRKKGE